MSHFTNTGGQQFNAPGGTQNFGIPPEQLGDLIAQAIAPLAERTAEAGVKENAVVELARRVARHVDDFDDALKALEETIQIAIRVQQEGRREPDLTDPVEHVLRRVRRLSAEGNFEAAIAELDDAIDELDEALERDDSALLRSRKLRLLDAIVDQHLITLDAEAAAFDIAERIDLQTTDPAARFDALRAEQDVWYERGRDKGPRLDLEVAIALAEITRERATDADQHGRALNDLGLALWALGSRDTDTDRLERAVTAFEAALLENSRDRVPLDWAMTQLNLGAALRALASREVGTDRLEQAVAAYEAALL